MIFITYGWQVLARKFYDHKFITMKVEKEKVTQGELYLFDKVA